MRTSKRYRVRARELTGSSNTLVVTRSPGECLSSLEQLQKIYKNYSSISSQSHLQKKLSYSPPQFPFSPTSPPLTPRCTFSTLSIGSFLPRQRVKKDMKACILVIRVVTRISCPHRNNMSTYRYI